MRAHVQNTVQPKQRGAAIMIMLLILILGSASFLLGKLGKGDARQPGNIAAPHDLGAINDALIGYAVSHGFCLPCPDTNNDGVAEANCGTGAPVSGRLPWVTLGVGALDSWGHRLRYVVDPDFTGAVSCAITASINGDISVRSRDSSGNLFSLVTNAPATFIVHGANGFGALDESFTASPQPPASHIDETINLTATTNLIQRTLSDDPTSAGGPFDDLLSWVNLAQYKAQLVKANNGVALPP